MSRGLQWTANFGRGVLDLGFGAWDGFLDNSRQIINRVSPWPFRTKTVRTMETLAVEPVDRGDQAPIVGSENLGLSGRFAGVEGAMREVRRGIHDGVLSEGTDEFDGPPGRCAVLAVIDRRSTMATLP